MEKEIKPKTLKGKMMYILSGSVLTEDFFVKNRLFIGIIFVLLIFYINNRYDYIEQMTKIEKLKKDLKDAKYEYQIISSQLTGVSRQSQIQKIVERDDLNLQMAAKPTYEVDANDERDKDKKEVKPQEHGNDKQ